MRLLTALIILAVAPAAACSPEAVASMLPNAGPLVRVTTQGGECFDGPCGGTTVIERDGRVHQTVPTGAELGRVPADVLAALDAAVRTANFDAIRAVPFTGECPTAFDGQEWVYEFGAPGGVERIASCETEIDPASPPIAGTTTALVAIGVLPAP